MEKLSHPGPRFLTSPLRKLFTRRTVLNKPVLRVYETGTSSLDFVSDKSVTFSRCADRDSNGFVRGINRFMREFVSQKKTPMEADRPTNVSVSKYTSVQ